LPTYAALINLMNRIMNTILEVKDLTMDFGGLRALDHLDLQEASELNLSPKLIWTGKQGAKND
jgi:ABC-type uncharacterized transport system ATPase subunit